MSPNPAVENYSIVTINGSDDPDGAGGNPANHFPETEGSMAGIDIDIANQKLYFVTQRLGAAGTAGVFVLDLVTHNYTEIWQQQSNNATNFAALFPTTQMEYIEVDTIGGKYYVTTLNSSDTAIGHDGTMGDEGGSRIFIGNLTGPVGVAPTPFASVFENTANGAALGMEINYAPTLSVTDAGSTYTEAPGNPSPLGTAVAVISASSVADADQTVIKGATVVITSGFIPTVDTLTFTNSGGITGTWTATTGVLSFTGNGTFAAYQTVLNSVRFTASGDNPTAYGTNLVRTFSFSVTDGLAWSDLGTSTVDVVGVNDAPVNNGVSAKSGNEDSLITISGLSITDVDADPANQTITVALSVTNGTLTLNTAVANGIVSGDIHAEGGRAVGV